MSTILSFAAHPTPYQGTLFRSRLEARWAAFFDLIGWRWEYEPFDLYGWVPDFIINGAGNNALLVEVKPFIFTAESDPIPGEDVERVEAKINRALDGSEWESLLLGIAPFIIHDGLDVLCCGRISDVWTSAPFVGNSREGYGVTSYSGSYHHRLVAPFYNGSMNGIVDRDEDFDDLRLMWAESGNVTRWRP